MTPTARRPPDHRTSCATVAASTLVCLVIAAAGCGTASPQRGANRSTASTSTAATSRLPPTECPRTAGGRDAKGVAISLGAGPAYPVLGMAQAPPAALGVVVLDGDTHEGGLYLHKTLWAISPRAKTAIVVRAESLPTRKRIGFFDGPQPRGAAALRAGTRPELRLPRSPAAGEWEYAVTATALPGSGCYAFHVRGPGIAQRIVFRAVLRTDDARGQPRARKAREGRVTTTQLELALRTNPNHEASSATCRTSDPNERDRARKTFGKTRRPLFVCDIALRQRRAEAFDVQVLPNGCFVAERVRGGQADYGCLQPRDP